MTTSVSTEANSPLTSEPVFDLPQLLERCMGNLAFAENCLTKFQQSLEADVEQLQQFVITGDPEEVARLAHRIKGSAATITATPLAERADDLEKAALQCSPDTVELSSATTALVNEVERFINTVPLFSEIG